MLVMSIHVPCHVLTEKLESICICVCTFSFVNMKDFYLSGNYIYYVHMYAVCSIYVYVMVEK